MAMPSGAQPRPGPFARAVAAEVRAAMGRRMVTQAQLATRTGMSQSYLSKRLRDEASFTTHDVEVIAEVLGEDLAALVVAAARSVNRARG